MRPSPHKRAPSHEGEKESAGDTVRVIDKWDLGKILVSACESGRKVGKERPR